MTKSELLALIANRENSGGEWKRDDIRPEQLAKEAVAFANFQGGRILLGVDDDGTISGIQRRDLELWVMDTVFGRYVHPMIIPFYEEIQVDEEHRVAVITVSQGVSTPYVVRSQNREENIHPRRQHVSTRNARAARHAFTRSGGCCMRNCCPSPAAGLPDLSLDRVMHYLSAIVGEKSLPTDHDHDAWVQCLCRLGIMVEGGDGQATCTIAGLSLFGHRPRRLLPQAGVRWMAFDGVEKGYAALDDRLIDGPAAALKSGSSAGVGGIVENGVIENLVDAMRPFVSDEDDHVGESMRRERRWHYPLEAVREALINALAHRDWTRNEEIEVVRYADRLEILSPGALPNTMTVEKVKAGQRSARNPLIVDVLRDYGYVDARGMGVRNKIIPLMQEHNGAEPVFEATQDYVRLTLPRRSLATAKSEARPA